MGDPTGDFANGTPLVAISPGLQNKKGGVVK
jgi:hypothetical protein